MEFYSNHSKILKSSNDSDKDLSNIFVSKFESNDSIKEQSFKISIDRNNNKHVLSPLGLSQGPRGIKVSRLSLQCSESSIRHSLIQQFGIQNKNNQNRSYNIRSIVLESAAGPSPTRWAIVTFTTSYDAEKALQMALKSQSVELHPGYDLFDYDDINLTTNCPQGLDEFHPKASRTLQISNLPLHLNNFKTLYEYFSKLGKVLDIEIKPKLVLHASALVQFSDISKVVKILVSPRAVLKCLVGSSITSSTSFQFGPSFPTNCIWLGQISNSINENQITEYFSRFGHVLEVVQDIKQQKALVYLDNAFAAQQSIIHLKRKNSVLGTCRVQVDYASLECQATISYWLSNNFPTLPVPPETVTPKQPQSDNSLNNNAVFNRCASRINSNQEKLVLNINKSNTNDQNPQNLHICVTKSSDLPPSNSLSNHDQVNHTQPTISIKNYPNSVGNSVLNISEMVITERIQADNTTRVTPICNKRSNNIRVTNPYDSNCDTTNNRFLQNYEPAINISSSHMNQAASDYQNQSSMNIKKDRNYSETNNEGKIVNNIRLSCSPVTWSTNTTTSQTSDINKSDMYNGQFSPWSAPVRNRVVARVDPFSHTSSNTHNSSQANTNLLSKTIQNSQFANRIPNAIPSHNINRNIQRTLSSFSEKDLNATIKPENFVSINKSLVHSIDREFGNMKRKTNYNQPLTYRIAKNSDNIQKPFDNRTPIYSSVHKLKTLKNFNYKTDISEIPNKPITAAEVFGEDFSDLSDSDSASSFVSNNRKRKQKLSKCKSPSVDSSSTISVLSSEKQNRFIRVSKVHYHTNKKLMHLKPKRLKNRLESNKCSSENVSSDEACSDLRNSNLNRSKMKISIKDKSETMNSSMKPLTVNVSLSNFEDNPIESDELSSPITDNSSVELPKRCLNINKKSNQLSNKRKIPGDKSIIYRNDNSNLSSSSDNEHKNFKRKYKINSSRKSKSFHNEYDERKRSNSYAVDRRYKENKYVSKISDSRSRKMKFNDDHHSKTKVIYNSSNYEKDNEKNSYLSRHRQDSDSPPIKHKKIRHDEIDKANIYRSNKKLIKSSFSLDFHSAFKRHEYQQLSQEISSDAVFQKEFDEFKRDQASDQSSVHRKGNSSKVSSASSIGVKTFSSYEKYKAQKPTKSSKITNVYTTSPDCKNIFQIDMNNINMYESMYDKVKRRAQKQAETKINHNSPEINEPRNKRKSKMLEHKHKSLKENKVYYKRHKKSRDVVASPTSTVYSDDSSVLVDDSQSNYSSTRYVISEKDKKIHNRKIYKSTKNSTVSSFESPNSFSATNWKRSKNKDEMLRIFKYSSNKMHEIKYFNSKKLENDYENDNEEHESISEFSFKTNASNINFPSKPVKEFINGELEEVANVSDATASTEPMEYAEVDLESLKMSDDDWKSGLSSQSSSESGNNMTKIEMNIVELSMENTTHTINEKQNISEKSKLSNFESEDCSDLKTVATKRDFVDNVIDNKEETFINSPCHINNDDQLNENKEVDIILTEVNNHECVKEEQEIAIASIMLKEENDSKSPIDWKSNIPNDLTNIDASNNSIKHIFEDPCNKENITNSDLFNENDLNNDLENNSDLNKNNILESSSEQLFTTPENVIQIPDPISSHDVVSENLSTHDQLEIDPIEKQQTVPPVENCNTVSESPIIAFENNKLTEIKSIIDPPVSFNNEIASIENSSPVISVITPRNNKPIQQGKSNNTTNEKIDLTSYVKGVIEQVKREQNAENQNKLKLEKNSNKRIKKLGNCNIVPSKNSQTIYNSITNNLSVSLLTTFQKSPTVSLQAAVIETPDTHISSYNPSSAPNIPGVNVCSPVTNVHLSTVKPILETTISSLPEILVNKPAATRPNVISIINLSSGTALKSDHPINNSVLSELKVNTELNTVPTTSELHSAISDQISAQLSNNSLKSPLSEDHAKQRICTRLRRADPSKADSNYKIVTTTCVTRADFNTTNNNYNTKVSNSDNNKIQIKHNDNTVGFVSENMPLSSDKISDPYEPNFDESPLEYSRYQTKSKTAFFPNDNKTSKEEIGYNLKLVSTNTINPTQSVTCSGIDSVSQIIEDVVHGNFNYSDYLTSFKNGKLSSFQISPSTTPLTFVSNDSRDCSSVSADNMNNLNCETVATSYKKHSTSLKLVNNVAVNIDDVKKTDLSSNSSLLNNKPTVALLASIPPSNINLCNLFTTNKTITQKESTISNSVPKSNNQSSSISVFNSNLSQTNAERLTFINLYKPKEKTALKTNSISLEQPIQSNIPISSFQLQSYNRDLTSTTCTSPFEKETAKMAGKFDQNLPITISKNNLLNINVNSSMAQKNVNPLLSTVVHSQEENHVLKTYLNILQRSTIAGINSSTLSKLQNAITDLPIKDATSQCDSNTYRNLQNINQLDSLTLQNRDASDESVNSNVLGNSSNIFSRSIADLIIPRIYPLIWEGKLSLKNEEARVALHFVHGNTELLNACMHLLIFSGSLQWNNTGSLKIVQRMRLDLSQLEGVQRRMQNPNEYCIGLALPGGDDINQWMKQSQILKEGFIKYMREKGAAGIINVCHPENNQQGLYVVHIFPPCEFSTNQLLSTAPDLHNIIEMNKFPNLLVVITTV